MKWFVNLTTQTKLTLIFGAAIALLVIVIITARMGISTIEKSQKGIFNFEFANTKDILEIKASEGDVRLALLMMMSVSERSDKERWHQNIKANSAEIDRIQQRLAERNKQEPSILRKLEEMNMLRLAFKETRDTQLIPFIYQGRIAEAKNLALGIQSERFEKIRSITAELVRGAEEEAQRRITESELEIRQIAGILVIVGAIAAFISIITALFLNRIIARPLTEISGAAEKIASGDLTVNVPNDNRVDEVGIMAQTFCRMVENLGKQIRDIMEAVNILASSSNQIASTAAQLASSTEQTAVAVTETTTTVEEVKQTVNLSSQKARHVSDVAQRSAQVFQFGERLVNETIDGITQIQEQMNYIAETIVRLSEHNQAIGEIIAAVDDLAEQSNLLAVNASIEAAKAGEYGKGFIVVAQEIKSLSEQSRQSTKQVRTILGDIQRASNAAVMATEKGSKAVEASIKQSAGTRDSIRELSKSIAEASQAAVQIAASSQQQMVGMDQVTLAMASIKQAAMQNAVSTKQVEATVKSLQEIGQKLKRLVEYYRA
ncbi:MAG: methyl-accepting chemotaxis protein [Deltaproteobacteria bacterium]|nr:methyl-accepting chemotaxis protein [Deltaproteobacteria bacterium]